MRKADAGEGCLSILFGGFFILIFLAIALGLLGFDRNEIAKIWAGLGILWVPALFVFGARNSN